MFSRIKCSSVRRAYHRSLSTVTNPKSMLQTFQLPEAVTGTKRDKALARSIIQAWRTDGIFQVAATNDQAEKTQDAFDVSKEYFQLPISEKSKCVSDLSYTGYIASGEELTAGESDFSEIFTVTKDIPMSDKRVRSKWPCHGPAPWPSSKYAQKMTTFTGELGKIGEKLLKLVALGLNFDSMDALTNLTADGWHHMRVLRFPTVSNTNSTRGIGSHTDYGLLVIAAQDEVGGLYIRPPVEGEVRKRNWLESESAAGMYENEGPWTYVTPVPKVFTVFPGDIMQFITNGYLLSTPHKVKLASQERFSLAYFHEPNFNATVRPMMGDMNSNEHIHYGTHFTNMFMRCYPERITTQRIMKEDRLSILSELREESILESAPKTRQVSKNIKKNLIGYDFDGLEFA